MYSYGRKPQLQPRRWWRAHKSGNMVCVWSVCGLSLLLLFVLANAPVSHRWKPVQQLYLCDDCDVGRRPAVVPHKRVLVTGAAGFIGHEVCLALQRPESGADVVVGLDSFNDYYSIELKRARQQRLTSVGVTVVEGDLCHRALIQQLFTEYQFTHVVHLAAQAGVRYSLENPQAYVYANVQCFVELLEEIRSQEDTKLVFASSSSVYGLNQKTPFSERDPVDSPASLYAATKKADEAIAHVYHHLYNVSTTALRFFTVYGPWGRPDMAYFSFLADMQDGIPVKIFNQGEMRRDFTFVSDIVDGVLASVDLGASTEVFNLGNDRPVRLMDFVSILRENMRDATGSAELPGELELVGMAKGDVKATHADISHAREKLGYQPKVSLREGLGLFTEWFFSAQYQPVYANVQSLRRRHRRLLEEAAQSRPPPVHLLQSPSTHLLRSFGWQWSRQHNSSSVLQPFRPSRNRQLQRSLEPP